MEQEGRMKSEIVIVSVALTLIITICTVQVLVMSREKPVTKPVTEKAMITESTEEMIARIVDKKLDIHRIAVEDRIKALEATSKESLQVQELKLPEFSNEKAPADTYQEVVE